MLIKSALLDFYFCLDRKRERERKEEIEREIN